MTSNMTESREENGVKCSQNYGHVIIGFLQFDDQIKKHSKKTQPTNQTHTQTTP